jgi:hypothetical protein
VCLCVCLCLSASLCLCLSLCAPIHLSNNPGCFSSYTRKLAISLYSFGTTPLQHLTAIAQKQNKPLKPPKRVKFLPSSTKKTYNNNNNNTNRKEKTKQNKNLTTYNNNNNNNTFTCCKTFQTSK